LTGYDARIYTGKQTRVPVNNIRIETSFTFWIAPECGTLDAPKMEGSVAHPGMNKPSPLFYES